MMEIQNEDSLHISQLIQNIPMRDGEENLTLDADGDEGRIEISVRRSTKGNHMIAFKAIEYCVEDEPESREWDNLIELGDAIRRLAHPVPSDSIHILENGKRVFTVVEKVDLEGVEGMYAYPLVWKEAGASTFSALFIGQ